MSINSNLNLDNVDLSKDTKLKKVCLICYPESLPDSIENVINTFADVITSYAYILHDRDYNDLGELKKPHYHLIMTFSKPMNTCTLLKAFNVGVYKKIRNMNGCIQYLIHKGNLDKTQYRVDEIEAFNIDVVNIIENVNLTGEYEIDGLSCILNYIKYNPCTLATLLDYVIKEHLYAVYRANYSIIKDILNEYNKYDKNRDNVCVPYIENDNF